MSKNTRFRAWRLGRSESFSFARGQIRPPKCRSQRMNVPGSPPVVPISRLLVAD